eukprot:Partr_v1_DN28646_c1_g1_i2_m49946 putative serine arginine repetitive matrix
MVGHSGGNAQQDTRFRDKQKALKESLKFPPSFSTRLQLDKINMDVMKPWITNRIYSLLGMEDEVIPEYVFSLLEQPGGCDPKDMQINLTGFLERKTGKFMNELWTLLIDAQQSESGIPSSFIEEKKAELLQKRTEGEIIKLEISNGPSPTKRNKDGDGRTSELERIRQDQELRDRRPLPPRHYRHDQRREYGGREYRRDRSPPPPSRRRYTPERQRSRSPPPTRERLEERDHARDREYRDDRPARSCRRSPERARERSRSVSRDRFRRRARNRS